MDINQHHVFYDNLADIDDALMRREVVEIIEAVCQRRRFDGIHIWYEEPAHSIIVSGDRFILPGIDREDPEQEFETLEAAFKAMEYWQ